MNGSERMVVLLFFIVSVATVAITCVVRAHPMPRGKTDEIEDLLWACDRSQVEEAELTCFKMAIEAWRP